MITSALNIASINRTSDTQFRTEMSKEQVEGLTDLIERGVQWKTPIQVARVDGVLFLTDGFHRVEAYEAAGYAEIPAGQYEIVECETMNEVIMLSMRANAAHGHKNTTADRVRMVDKLIQMDEKRFMKNPFLVNIDEVMAALQLTKKQARLAVDPKNSELKSKRWVAIVKRYKQGMSGNAIAKELKIGQSTVSDVIREIIENERNDEPKLRPGSIFTTPMTNVEYYANLADLREANPEMYEEELKVAHAAYRDLKARGVDLRAKREAIVAKLKEIESKMSSDELIAARTLWELTRAERLAKS
ncbi:ParB N-terminal domain-containing protein [Aeromonas media]|uniref:ParB N-terminal domain-containing protein n=1 Tax=Aeromonas media TaxID=651 RepID=UPI002280A4BB|nr:ParB N-terminal domain-containing protein [Aeromonas media]MCY9836955.1 ParB N-terminal domain-containing protein [Aeromonas media]